MSFVWGVSGDVMENLKVVFEQYGTGQISDAMGKTGVPHGIYAMNPQLRLFGRAFTAQVSNNDNLTLHLATKEAKPGDVIVVESVGVNGAAMWGELMTLCAIRHGICGVIIDGFVRDKEALRELRFPVYARGVSPLGPARQKLGNLNIPIQCGGLTVNPGDYVIGDSDGVVFIPAEQVLEIIEATRLIEEKEAKIKKSIISGEYLFDYFNNKEV